jgi:hypothetical protein
MNRLPNGHAVRFAVPVWRQDSSAQAEHSIRWRPEYVREYQVTVTKYLDGRDMDRCHYRHHTIMNVNAA